MMPNQSKIVANEIFAERQRQKDVEGWSAEHDNDWMNGELPQAAAAYATVASAQARGTTRDAYL